MANIRPDTDLPAEQPLPTPFASVPYSPEGFGADLGNVADQGGKLFGHLALRSKLDGDDTAKQAAETRARQSLNSIILDPDTGYAATKGVDAMDGRDKYLGQFNKAINETLAGLSDDQRRIAGPQIESIREQGNTHAFSHEAVQQRVYKGAQARGNLDETMVTLEHVIADPKAVQEQIDSIWRTGIDAARAQYGENASHEAISSVVMPELQKAALGGMEAAIATQNPALARGAFEKLGPYLITNHQRFYANAVQAMEAKQTIAQQTGAILAGAAESVAVPGGQPVGRLDPVKVGAALEAVPADSPHAAQIVEAVKRQEDAQNRIWNATVANVAMRVHSAGQNPVTGEFSLSDPKISAADKVWLNQNAPGELDKLKALETKTARPTSSENLSALTADMHDDAKWSSTYAQMSPAQFLRLTLDQGQFPGGFTGPDRLKAQAIFNQRKAGDSKLEEPIGRTVKNVIADAFPDDPYQRKAFEAKFFEPLRSAAQTFLNSEKAAGRKVNTDAIEKLLQSKMARVPSGAWYKPDKRGIEIDTASVVNAPPAPAPQKAIRSYRYTSDRKQRAPVYNDGSQGPLEANQ